MESGHTAHTILQIIIILLIAKVLGEIFERIKQPAVLGELIAGVILGGSVLGFIHAGGGGGHGDANQTLHVLAELGVILLLFEIGLESDIEEFKRVGWSAALVAVIGIVCPFAVGYLVARYFGMSNIVSIFIGATLTATSVGITARTLSDLGQLRTSAAKIVLGAAVIDDVLGLMILAVVSGLCLTGTVCTGDIAKITLLALGFIVGAIAIGIPLAPYMMKIVRRLRVRGMLTISAVLSCLVLAYSAERLGLATIVGAFAAGLVLARTEDQVNLQEKMKPVADIFIPIFFVMLGVSVDLSVFNPVNPETRSALVMTLAITGVAILMKVISGLGVLHKGVSKLLVGVGMIPRGEVGLIFASIGLARGVINAAEYGAIIAVVVVTTFITPPLLKVALRYSAPSKS